jgi:hypothetical protein
MAILAYQAFIVFSLIVIRIVARRHLATACFVWSGFTVLNLFFWPLILVQLAVVWVTYAVLKPKDDTPPVSDEQLGPLTNSPFTPATAQPLAPKPEKQLAAKQSAGKPPPHENETLDTPQTILGTVNEAIADFNSFVERASAIQQATSLLDMHISREKSTIELYLGIARSEVERDALFAKNGPIFQETYEKYFALLSANRNAVPPEEEKEKSSLDYVTPNFSLPTRHANADIANAIEQCFRELQQQREAFFANLKHTLDRDTALRTHFFKSINSFGSKILEAELYARLQMPKPTAESSPIVPTQPRTSGRSTKLTFGSILPTHTQPCANAHEQVAVLNQRGQARINSAQLQQDIDRGRLVAILKRISSNDAIIFLSTWLELDGELIGRFADSWDWEELSKNTALPWSLELLERFEDRWDWDELSKNKALPWSLELLERFHNRLKWHRGGLTENEGLPWSLELLERFEIRWDWGKIFTGGGLSKNKALPWSIELLERFEDRWDWGSEGLSQNKALPWSIELLERFEDRWDWGSEGLSQNEGLPWSLELLERFEDRWGWGISGLSKNKALAWSIELLERFQNRWVWEGLSTNKALPWSIELLERFEDRWRWGNYGLSENEGLPWSLELLERFEDRWGWGSSGLSKNKALPWSIELLERFEDRWDWGSKGLCLNAGLSQNEGLAWSLELLERFEDRWVWDWEGLSTNKALPWSLELLERFENRWHWRGSKGLSTNEAMPWSLELLERFKDRWHWRWVATNKALPLSQLRPVDIDEIMSHHFPGSDAKPAIKKAPFIFNQPYTPEQAQIGNPATQSDAGTDRMLKVRPRKILTLPQTSEQVQISNPATQCDAGTDRMLKVRPRKILIQPRTSEQAQIGNLATQSDAVLSSRRANIQAQVAERSIRHLIHFTRVANLESIMYHGLLSVQTAHQQGVVPLVNDQLRLDGHKDAISLSIGFPNSAMFYKYRQLHPQERWVVLLLRPEILWTHDCAYCLHNAADKRISSRPWSEFTRDEAFQSMFAEAPDGTPSRTVQRLGLFDPTDVQAEVLVRGNIDSSMLVEMVFEHPDDLEAHRHHTVDRVARVVQVPGSDFFASRRFARNGGVG